MRRSLARTSTSPVGTLAFVVSARSALDRAEHRDDVFRAQALGALEQFLVALDDHLRVAVPIAHVDEQQRSEIANAMHPSQQHDVAPTSVARRAPQVCVRARVTELLSHRQ